MEYLLVFILAVLVAMISNYAGPKFYASKLGSRLNTNYPMRTLATAIVLFGAILSATLVLSFATKATVKLPNA